MALKAPDVPHLAGRDAPLLELGFSAWEAAWLALVCLHSGVFTRAQLTRHQGCDPKTTRNFLARLVDAGVAREHPVPGNHHNLRYCHVYGRGLYRAVGVENVRHRRKAEDVVLFRRLLSFDHVVQRSDLPWLATEQEKVEHFTGRGIGRDRLPSRLYGGARRTRRYFALKLPIAADETSATFVYVDPGRYTDRELKRWAAEHGPLWSDLRGAGVEVRVAGVARTAAARYELAAKFDAWTAEASTAQALTPEDRQALTAAEADLAAALTAGDPRSLERWGGLNPCRRLVISLRRRADLEDSAGARIDAWSSHHAQALGPEVLA